MEDINYIGAGELIFNTDKENSIYSGGFDVKSVMMKAGISPIMTLNDQTSQMGGGVMNKVSDLFDSLVIPNWVLSYNNRIIGGESKDIKDNYDNSDDESNEDIDDDLHDKLLDLVREHDLKTGKEKTDKEKKGGKKTRKIGRKTKKNITKKKK
jgi:hypothetical protein